VAIPEIQGWVSPRLGIRFDLTADTLAIYGPNGDRFLTSVALAQARDHAQQQAEAERQRADRLAQRLRALGIDPDQV